MFDLTQNVREDFRELASPMKGAAAYIGMIGGFLVFIPVSMLFLFVIGLLVRLAINAPVHTVLIAGPDNPLRAWLELCYFVANLMLAAVAWFALRFAADQARQARKQAAEAEHARFAQIYLEISSRFLSEEVTESRLLCAILERKFARGQSGYGSLGEYIHHELELLRNSMYFDRIQSYLRHIDVLSFFEHVGALAKQGYVRYDDIALLFRGAIQTSQAMFGHHIKMRRGTNQLSMYRNFTDLSDWVSEFDRQSAGN